MTLQGRKRGWLGVVAASLLVVSACTASSGGSGDSQTVFDLSVGTCFDAGPDDTGPLTEVTVVACDRTHDYQVYLVTELDFGDGQPTPTTEVMSQRARQECSDEFVRYVGVPYRDSELFARYVVPSESAWERGDRTVICLLYDPQGPMTGSQREGSS